MIKSVGLYLGSNPLPHELLTIDHVDEHRRVRCRRYTNCITYAAAEKWESMTCSECSIREEVPMHSAKEDIEGLTTFLLALNLR